MTEAEAVEIADLVKMKAEAKEWLETVIDQPDDADMWTLHLIGYSKHEDGNRRVHEFEPTGREFGEKTMHGAMHVRSRQMKKWLLEAQRREERARDVLFRTWGVVKVQAGEQVMGVTG